MNTVEEESEIPNDAAEDLQTDQQDMTWKRKRKKTQAPGELDFWLCLEDRWKEHISEWDDDVRNSAMWKRFVIGSLALDNTAS